MRQLFLVGILCLLVGVPIAQVTSQTMVVHKTDGSEQNIDLSLLRNFLLPSGSLLLNYKDNSSRNFSLSDVKKLVFDASTGGKPGLLSQELTLCPNPAKDKIYVYGLSADITNVKVFSVDGQCVISSNVASANNGVDVSGLVPGVYLVKVNSTVIKFVKQ